MDNKKILIMCEGPNELEIIKILLENDKLKFSYDNLLNLVPYHARQITGNVKTALNLYSGEVIVLRVGDKLNEQLKIKGYESKIKEVHKICTKPELEILLIIANNLLDEYNKVKSKQKPKEFAKINIKNGKKKYDNSTKFYTSYFGGNITSLIDAITEYKRVKRHNNEEFFLADLLK